MLNVSKQMAYIILAISIIIEIIGDAMLTASSGYENKLLGIGAIITILFPFSYFPKCSTSLTCLSLMPPGV